MFLQALEAVDKPMMAEIEKRPDRLKGFLKYHIMRGKVILHAFVNYLTFGSQIIQGILPKCGHKASSINLIPGADKKK